jgi:hypothetical protein
LLFYIELNCQGSRLKEWGLETEEADEPKGRSGTGFRLEMAGDNLGQSYCVVAKSHYINWFSTQRNLGARAPA